VPVHGHGQLYGGLIRDFKSRLVSAYFIRLTRIVRHRR
jgi:hypothetical protein